MSNITSKSHFKLFKKEVQRWVKRLGLTGWHLEYTHDQDLFDSSPALVQISVVDRIATFHLNEEWEIPVTEALVKKAAFHEVCELLLARFDFLATSRFCMKEEVDEERHAVIRILENMMFSED